MIKRILLISTLIIGVILLVNPYVYTRSAGAPTGSAGAPNEQTCAAAYCHTGNIRNSGDGVLYVKLLIQGNEVGHYIPGYKYIVRVELAKPNSLKWGFQTSVRSATDAATTAGILNASGTDVRLLTSGTRTYVTHTQNGTNKQNWEFEWTAPKKGSGNVTIYTAANAANGNGNTLGDFIYTNQLNIQEDLNASVLETHVSKTLKIFPNPANDILNFSFELEKPGLVEANILDISGKKIRNLYYGNKNSGLQSIKSEIEDIAPGVYLLHLTVGRNSSFHRIVVQ